MMQRVWQWSMIVGALLAFESFGGCRWSKVARAEPGMSSHQVTLWVGNQTKLQSLASFPFRQFVGKDPNFASDPTQVFRGVPLQALVDKTPTRGTVLTVVATDQYIYHDYYQNAVNAKAVLVFDSDGKPLPKTRGGPLTLMFAGEAPREQFIWYTKLIAVDPVDQRALLLPGSQQATVDQLQKWGEDLPVRLPIPRGWRHPDLVSKANSKPFYRGLPLDKLHQRLPGLAVAVAQDVAGNSLPFTRQEGWWLATHKDKKPIALSDGGPYIVFQLVDGKVRHAFFFVTQLTRGSSGKGL